MRVNGNSENETFKKSERGDNCLGLPIVAFCSKSNQAIAPPFSVFRICARVGWGGDHRGREPLEFVFQRGGEGRRKGMKREGWGSIVVIRTSRFDRLKLTER